MYVYASGQCPKGILSMVRKYLVVIIAAILAALIVWQWFLDVG